MFAQEIERKIGDFREPGFPEFIPRESRLQMADNRDILFDMFTRLY